MVIRTLLLMAAVCSFGQSYAAGGGSSSIKSDSLSVRKNAYPTNGYRAFMEYGAGLYIQDGGKNQFHQEWTTIHGYQINPKWYVGLGGSLMLTNLYGGGTAFVDGRFEPTQDKTSPFFDLRVGYTLGDVEGVYISPAVGCRISRFNLSFAYEFQKKSAGSNSSDLQFSKESGLVVRLGWDFGARWKDKSLRYKRPHLGTGYRGFIESSFAFFNDWGCESIVATTIHGKQILPQLFVGAGVSLEDTYIDYDRPGYSSYFSYACGFVTPFLSVRYDALPKAVSPFLEARVGYRCSLSNCAKDDPFYISPSVGVRLSKFNLAVSYESRNTDLEMRGYYRDYHLKKHFAYPMFHLGFDFGSRVKQENF